MSNDTTEAIIASVQFGDDGLMPAIIQQEDSGRVLMVAWMDAEALRRTLAERVVTFWSRSRSEYWRKGDTSGNALHVRSVALDCDSDTLLVTVAPVAAACHTGAHSCFDVRPIDLTALGSAP